MPTPILHIVKRLFLRESRKLVHGDRALRQRLWHHPFFLAFSAGRE